jgi:hypothetical protein
MSFVLASIVAIAPVLATGSAVEGPRPASALALLDPVDRPAEPERRGTGLLVTGGILGGLGLITNVTRIGLAQGLCRDISYDFRTASAAGIDGCMNGAGALLMLSPAALALNATSFALVAGGGRVRGRWRAYESVHEGARGRRGGVQIGVGAGLMTAALVGYAISRVASFADVLGAQTCLSGGLPDSAQAGAAAAACMRTRWSGYLAGITASQALSVVGVGLLAHGASYRRHSRLYRKAAAMQLRVAPSFAPTWAGLALSGRF